MTLPLKMLSVASTITGLCLALITAGVASATPLPSSFPNRVAAGDVTGHSAILWAHSTVAGPCSFVLSTNADFNPTLFTTVTNVDDIQVPVKVAVHDLTPGMRYYFRVTASDRTSDSGRFLTPASAGAFAGVRFGVSGDWRGELAPYPSLANAPGRNLDFFVALGDTIYADYLSPAVPEHTASTLAEFRAKHNEVYSTRLGMNTLADLRASTAFFAVIDDHEIVDDFAGGAQPLSDPRFAPPGAFINETVLYRAGVQAFGEFNPLALEQYDTPEDPRTDRKPKWYRARQFGDDAAFFLLDCRSYRDTELAGVKNPLDFAAVEAFNAASFDRDPITGKPLPHRTLLGAAQLAQLKSDLWRAKTNGVLWKFILVGEPIQNLGVAGASDRFEGYARERADLLQFIAERPIRNVVFISADIHGTVVNNLAYQAGPNQPLLLTDAFEIVTGAVAHDKPFAPTAFDVAQQIQIRPNLTLLDGLLNFLGLPSRSAFDALPLAERDRGFQSIMDIQLTSSGLDATGLEGSAIHATLLQGGYVAAHTYGWTEFEIDRASHWLTVTTYGIEPYSVEQVNSDILLRTPQIVSRFLVLPQDEAPRYPALTISNSSSQIQISWPDPGPGVTLEERSPSLPWSAVTNVPARFGTNFVMNIPANGSQRLFRLRQQPPPIPP